ncbi:hypothetical protein SAMN05421841_1080 [Chryseobacterium wanjuense]|uniref:Uncharacterized protein n=1 Tax=Chryseobacterium wanjuense TaxID=356305 RepID=A0A1I0P9F4_9FLAO|nr:hypothetical protein [Chryseobacterium wanjuense]SEW11001.1 hypothetical protein SAMN05421841_1080 [Chryseobacterium wanjuense]
MEKIILPQKNLQGIWEFVTGYEPAYFNVQVGDTWHFQYNINPSFPAEGKLEMFRADGALYNSGVFKQYEIQNPGPSGYELEIYMENLGASYTIQNISESSLFLQSVSPYRYPGNFKKVQQ